MKGDMVVVESELVKSLVSVLGNVWVYLLVIIFIIIVLYIFLYCRVYNMLMLVKWDMILGEKCVGKVLGKCCGGMCGFFGWL